MIAGALVDEQGRCRIMNCLQTETSLERLRGLLGRPTLGPDDAMLITPCASIHTLGMRYAIDVIYLDASLRILRCVEALPPWRFSACWAARATLELAAGAARRLGLDRGLQLRWCPAC